MTNAIVAPDRFWTVFIRELSTTLAQDKCWQGKWASDADWTDLMMSVLQKTGFALGFFEPKTISREYLRLDMAFYSYPRRPEDCSDRLWNLEVAIEHENSSEGWLDEWVKLSHLSCGLKVLITYHDHRPGRPSLDDKLKIAKDIYGDLSFKCPEDSWLLIFGPTYYSPIKSWFGYTFDGRAFALHAESAQVFPGDAEVAKGVSS